MSPAQCGPLMVALGQNSVLLSWIWLPHPTHGQIYKRTGIKAGAFFLYK
jgi:hypothetical protein